MEINTEVLILICWSAFSVVTLTVSAILIGRCKNIWISLALTYFISQPFSWTMLAIANGGGAIITPVPDLVGIYLFFIGFVTYEFKERYINACLPPSPTSTVIVYLIVFFIARRFKSVAYHHWFRKNVDYKE